MLFVRRIVMYSYAVEQKNAPLLNLIFHNIFYGYMFRIRGLIFRKTTVTSTRTV